MSDDRWTHTNWYARRLHIVRESQPQQVRGRIHRRDVSLCGSYVDSIEQHAKRRNKPPNYSKLPHCKLCERKAGAS